MTMSQLPVVVLSAVNVHYSKSTRAGRTSAKRRGEVFKPHGLRHVAEHLGGDAIEDVIRAV
jgi:hypothetical protein